MLSSHTQVYFATDLHPVTKVRPRGVPNDWHIAMNNWDNLINQLEVKVQFVSSLQPLVKYSSYSVQRLKKYIGKESLLYFCCHGPLTKLLHVPI
jgi:hypothetical protein